ncbi:hypothetical protein H2203_007169 [Taxawa tesnikishii (nom. ined.)]|nr:hypothetical protein H2203_007169 [Dothideales sp. JES 119]
MAQDAAALLRYLSATPCIVMGHSMGAIVASVLSIQDPDVVRALILIDVSYFLPAEPVKTMGEALTAASDPASAAVTALGALYTPDSPAWMLAVHRRRTLGMQNRALLGSFFGHVGEGKPGNQDAAYEYMVKRTKHKLAVYQSEAAATLERKLPLAEGDEVHVIDGSSHWVHEQRPNEFNEIMLAWLEKSEYFTLRN